MREKSKGRLAIHQQGDDDSCVLLLVAVKTVVFVLVLVDRLTEMAMVNGIASLKRSNKTLYANFLVSFAWKNLRI